MKKIDFTAVDINVPKILQAPKPSKNFIPEWYKTSKTHITDEKIPIHYDGKNNHTFKKCVPIMDSMISGYTFESQNDIYALNQNLHNGERFSWGNFPFPPIDSIHSLGQLQNYPTLNNFNEIFKWKFWWQIKTPPGYSCLFLHPLHRNDLPFITMSGIVDTDVYNAPIEFPFLLRDDFYGKISKGTPLVQIIPFKRDSWVSRDVGFSENIYENVLKNFSIIGDMYKKLFWQRKDYR